MFMLETNRNLSLFLPLLFSQLVYAISTFIGTAMIADFGHEALAALALGSTAYTTLCVFFFGIFVGISVLISRNIGSDSIPKTISTVVSQGFILAIICSIPFIAIMWIVPYFLNFMGQDINIVSIAVPYLRSLSFSILPWLLLVVIEQFLIGLSLGKLVMWISIIQVPIEVFINYAFVFGKFGLPECGIAGLGYGFTVTFILSLIIIAIYIKHSKHTKKYKIFDKIPEFNHNLFRELVNVGVPVGCTNIIENLFFLTIVLFIGRLGSEALAAQQIIRQYFDLSTTIGLAMAQVVTVRVGHFVGGKNLRGIKLSTRVSAYIVFLLMTIIGILYIFCPELLISLDIDITNKKNSNLVHSVKTILIVVAFFQIVDSLRLVIIGTLRGLEDTKIPMYITFATFWCIALPSAYIFAFIFDLKMIGIWIGLLIGILIGALIVFIRLYKTLNKLGSYDI